MAFLCVRALALDVGVLACVGVGAGVVRRAGVVWAFVGGQSVGVIGGKSAGIVRAVGVDAVSFCAGVRAKCGRQKCGHHFIIVPTVEVGYY